MTNPHKDSGYLSRSALAERLNLPLKELTQLMIDAGWIIQQENKWKLTAKGEFEGGVYRQSKKYGEYIVWPTSVLEHAAIRVAEEALVNVSSLAQQVKLPARLLNRLLAEAGWIEGIAKGWQLTPLGKAFSGVQNHDDDTGVPYVMWPRSLRDNQAFIDLVDRFANNASGKSLDGHHIGLEAHRTIADWLYLLEFSYSYQRRLGLAKQKAVCPDFYLPAHRLCIDFWPRALSAAELAAQLEKRKLYQEFELQAIEVSEDKSDDLDHQLSRQLVQHGITVY